MSITIYIHERDILVKGETLVLGPIVKLTDNQCSL